jgi:hydrogenase nickel incorporation protein HypA/HybF
MHELAIARYLLAAVERHLGAEPARVVSIELTIGAATGVAPDALGMAFAAVAHGTCAERAELRIHRAPGRSRCAHCAVEFAFDDMVGQCPRCGRPGGDVFAGDELMLETIEVADV